MKLYRITHVTEGGTRTKIAQKWPACRTAKAKRWLTVHHRNYPILETKIQEIVIPEDAWKDWTGEVATGDA